MGGAGGGGGTKGPGSPPDHCSLAVVSGCFGPLNMSGEEVRTPGCRIQGEQAAHRDSQPLSEGPSEHLTRTPNLHCPFPSPHCSFRSPLTHSSTSFPRRPSCHQHAASPLPQPRTSPRVLNPLLSALPSLCLLTPRQGRSVAARGNSRTSTRLGESTRDTHGDKSEA